MITRVFRVTNMHCTSCALVIEGELEDLGAQARCDFRSQKLIVTYDPNLVASDDITQTVGRLGYNLTESNSNIT